MRKTILSLSFILAASVGFTHAQDVLKKHGFKKKPLTFCDGQYNEFFNNPEVVQIGTTLFNTKTNKVVKLIDENTPKTTYKAEFSSMSIDPCAEKYYSISPYAYCAGNPVRYIDIKGKYIVDSKGYVMYSEKGGWTKYATKDAIRIGNSMMATNAGNNQFNNLVHAPQPITLAISSESKVTTTINADGSISKSYKLGNTHNDVNSKGEVKKSAITVYEGTINDFMKDTKDSKNPLNQSFQSNTTNNDQRIGAVAGHETDHATDPVNQQQSHDNDVNGGTNDLEATPTNIEMQILDQTGLNNMTPLPNPISTILPAPQPEPLK